jgi:hypothetical protein
MPVLCIIDHQGRPLASYKAPVPQPESHEAPVKPLWDVAAESPRLQSTNNRRQGE